MRNWLRLWAGKAQAKTLQNRRYRPRVEGLEERALLAAPVIDAIANVSGNIPAGKTTFVPITGSDADGDAITYSVTSSDPTITAQLHNGNTYLRMSVANFGDMTFQLFNDLTPLTVKQITDLVNSGFYNNLTFHRVIQNFVIQGGDPSGDGTGGPGFQFDDEFNPQAIFSGNGQLAMANSGKDTNGSQFFVTVGPQRALDFNHTIFGQLVRGFDTLDKIQKTPTNASTGRPITPVVISSASIVQDTTDNVLTLRAASGSTAGSTITITADDGKGSTSTRTFQAQAVADNTDDPAILGPVTNQTTPRNTPISFNLTGTDLEGNGLTFTAQILDSPANGTVAVNGNRITVTPTAGFVGTMNLQVGVQQTGATSRGSTPSPLDTQKITVSVTNTDAPLTAQGANVTTSPNVPLTDVTVATFSDADPTGKLGDYSATIDWGDGATTQGTIVAGSGGSFNVVGSHTFATAGSFTIRSTITGTPPATGVTPSTVSAAGTATVADNTTPTPPTDTTPPPTDTTPTTPVTTPTTSVAAVQPTASRQFLANAYRDVLQRDIESTAMEQFAALLDSGKVTRDQVMLGIQLSAEHRHLQVHNMYLRLLGRLADAGGLSAGIRFLMGGGTEAHLRSIIIASPEYAQARANTNAAFLTNLYQDAFGRTPDASGLNTFTNALNAGANRLSVANTLYRSPEFRNAEVATAYQTLLGRAPTNAELVGLSNFLANNGRIEQIHAAIATSAEYLGHHP